MRCLTASGFSPAFTYTRATLTVVSFQFLTYTLAVDEERALHIGIVADDADDWQRQNTAGRRKFDDISQLELVVGLKGV